MTVQHSAGVSLPRASSRAEPEPEPEPPATSTPPANTARQEPPACQALAAHIRNLDARARQGLTGREQDRLREARRSAFDCWTHLKCHAPIE